MVARRRKSTMPRPISTMNRPRNRWQLVVITPMITLLKHIITKANMWLLERTAGRLGNTFLGLPVLLLRARGAKSGIERVTPLFYLQHEGKVILVASNGGNVRDPAWARNLRVNPNATIEIEGKRADMLARAASGEECRRYWPMLTEAFPVWRKLQEKSGRRFPIVILEPRC